MALLIESGCDAVVVAVPPRLRARAEELLAERSEVTVVDGGETRQSSVFNALRAVDSDEVVIHDAARPLATPELVERVRAALSSFDGAVTALPLVDTLKKVDGNVVVDTVDRSGLWCVQTPQAFDTELLLSAHERASEDGFAGTDDAQLVERYGGSVAVVEGARDNLKLTFAGDLEVAEALLRAR